MRVIASAPEARSKPASLRPLRLKLALWNLATLLAIVLLLGAGLFVAINHQLATELDRSVRDVTAQLIRAAHTRAIESRAGGDVVDAVEELHFADRQLYLLDVNGGPAAGATPPQWVRDTVMLTPDSVLDVEHHGGHDSTLKMHAERFRLDDHTEEIAVVVANEVELEDRYASMIELFGAAALVALLMVAVGTWLLVHQATVPVELGISRMRRFMADAAHELRTPIAVLQAQTEVALQRERPVREYQAALGRIGSESQRLAHIVEEMLALARADAGEGVVEMRKLFLDDVVADAVESVTPLAIGNQVQLKLLEFNEAPVTGDAELLRRLVMVLLDNALKYTPAGGLVTVNVGVINDEAVLSIRDTGPGIPSDQLPHVFERFYRGDAARTRRADGSMSSGAGLGLAIARWIATTHGAEITLTPASIGGTEATVRFAVAPQS